MLNWNNLKKGDIIYLESGEFAHLGYNLEVIDPKRKLVRKVKF